MYHHPPTDKAGRKDRSWVLGLGLGGEGYVTLSSSLKNNTKGA